MSFDRLAIITKYATFIKIKTNTRTLKGITWYGLGPVQSDCRVKKHIQQDMARMYEWYEKVGTGVDITSLQK